MFRGSLRLSTAARTVLPRSTRDYSGVPRKNDFVAVMGNDTRIFVRRLPSVRASFQESLVFPKSQDRL